MNWFYAKDGQQIGPVAFSEIERLHAAGQLDGEALVWQQGTANWVKLSTVLATRAAAPAPAGPVAEVAPVTSPAPVAGAFPDYGDFLCWGFIAVLLPCLGAIVYIVLMVLHFIEYFKTRTAVQEGRLAASEYSQVHPVLFVLGLFCCGGLLYPLFMHLRNKSGYFKPQPRAVTVAIIVVIVGLLLGVANVAFQYSTGAFQQALQSH